MGYNNWQKGSQWRKWDLHVHTPASFHWNGGKLLRDMNSEEKEKSFLEMLSTIENSDVAVFCFMDYWTFDGYIQFKDFIERNKLNCTKTFFPGMELRIEAPVNYRLNIHVILSNSLSVQQLDDFKSRLMVRSISRRISDEGIMEFAKSLDASKAKSHGYADPKNLSQNELLQLGVSTIVITQESLADAIKSVPSGTAYIIMPYDTSDGLLELDWKAQPHADNYFMQSAHIFESRKGETVDLFLGIETDKNRDFLENFQKTLNYVQKPVICGSDAHRYSDYGKFPGGKATWIKSDPTFEGFKQIIYEPRERVLIQELQPHEKIPYRVIDKIRFVDNTNQKLFSSEWINLNENLNAIIGGKSSGKSLLLYHIAKTVAPNLIDERKKEVTILDYRFGASEQFDFEVMWKDGHCDKLSTSSESNIREIEYIPQLYVNALAEKQGKASLYKLIESILEQNADYKDFIQKVKQEISELEITIDSNIADLMKKREELQALYDERKAIGDFKAINDEINSLSSQILKLREDSNFTEDEELNYNRLMLLQAEERRKKRRYEELGYAIDGFTLTLKQIKQQSIQALEKSNPAFGLDSFSKRVLSSLMLSAVNTITNSLNLLISSQESLAQLARSKAEKCADNERKILENLKPYTAKINDQSKLKSFEEKLKKQQEIQVLYNSKTSQIEAMKESGVNTRNELFGNYTSLLDNYKRL